MFDLFFSRHDLVTSFAVSLPGFGPHELAG